MSTQLANFIAVSQALAATRGRLEKRCPLRDRPRAAAADTVRALFAARSGAGA